MRNLFKTTRTWSTWWRDRKIDWKKSYLDTWDHPHRMLISGYLRQFHWTSLFEIGCGAGANLVNIIKNLQGKQLGGIDINPDAIELAKKSFNGGFFKVGSAEDLIMSDSSVDVVLTDMTLIYISPRDIGRVIDEIKRVARVKVVFCELHSDRWINRLIFRFKTGYNAHNYKTLLERHGFYDIKTLKIPEEFWPGGEPQKTFGYLISANVPRRK